MYTVTNKRAAVKKIQEMLGLAANGIYDGKTKDAVLFNQKINALEQTGVVDYKTFNSIREAYDMNKLKAALESNVCFINNKIPLEKGDYGDGVVVLNTMLRNSIDMLRLSIQKPRGPYYSQATEEAVRALRNIFIMQDGSYVDELFYDRLRRLLG